MLVGPPRILERRADRDARRDTNACPYRDAVEKDHSDRRTQRQTERHSKGDTEPGVMVESPFESVMHSTLRRCLSAHPS